MTHLAKRNWLLQTWTCVLHDFRAKICCNKRACASFNSQGNDCNVPQMQRCSHQMAFIRLMTCSTLKFRFHRENIPSETVTGNTNCIPRFNCFFWKIFFPLSMLILACSEISILRELIRSRIKSLGRIFCPKKLKSCFSLAPDAWCNMF